jgi:hypothetical protein
LVALAAVGRLDLLGTLYGTVLVPDAVFREVVDAGRGRPGAAELPGIAWISMTSLESAPDRLLVEELGTGEAEAIALAVQKSARLLLLDDRRARRIAELAYGLSVKGAAGIVVSAKRRGLVDAARPMLESMRRHGYYLSDRVVTAACRAAGE